MPLFGRKEKGKVPLTNDVMMKCICGMCPVQAESTCSKPKLKMMMEMRDNMSKMGSEGQMGKMDPKPEMLPGPYCSIGLASCTDLDQNKACICRTCQVYKDFSLAAGKPVEHFCFNSKAV